MEGILAFYVQNARTAVEAPRAANMGGSIHLESTRNRDRFFSSPQIILLLLILFVDLAYMILKPGRPTSPIKSALDHVVHTTFSKKEPYFKWMVGSYAKVQIAACLVSSAGNIPQCCKARRRRSSFKSKCVLIGRASGCLCRWRLLRCLKDSM